MAQISLGTRKQRKNLTEDTLCQNGGFQEIIFVRSGTCSKA